MVRRPTIGWTHTHTYTHTRTHTHTHTHTHTQTRAGLPLDGGGGGGGGGGLSVYEDTVCMGLGSTFAREGLPQVCDTCRVGQHPIYITGISGRENNQIYGHVRCIYQVFLAGKSTKCTAMYGVYIRFWASLQTCF